MSVTSLLRLGTRGSDLALWQARHVATLVRERLNRECELVIVKTLGLKRLHHKRLVPDNAAIRGMLKKVSHLVTIKESSKTAQEEKTNG